MSGAPATTLRVCIAAKADEALEICSLTLVAAVGSGLPPFSAGSHLDVHLPGGLTRQYSISNDPAETERYVLGVLLDPNTRGGSRAVHELLQAAQTIEVSVPKNHFALVPDAKRSLLLAGGIGVTPILSMARQLAREGADFELHYAARSPERMAFRAAIERSGWAARARLHFDDGAAAQKLDIDPLLARATAGTHLYVCGPKGFIDAVLASARRQGWDERALHCELFAGTVAAGQTQDRPFEIQIASSGRLITVPVGTSAIHALQAEGVSVLTSCEQGVCGTCLTRVLEGVPDHRDLYLTPEEHATNDRFLPCCSRAKSERLVRDL